MKFILTAFCFVLLSLFLHFSAQACSPAAKNYLRRRQIYIYNNGKGIPKNGRIWIRYFGDTLSPWKDKLLDLKVLDSAGKSIPIDLIYHKSTVNQDFGFHMVELAPSSVYKSNSLFKLVTKISKDSGSLDKNSIISDDYIKLLEFSTGDIVDTHLPVVQNVPKKVSSYHDICETGGCCGPTNLRLKSYSVPRIVDDIGLPKVFYIYHSKLGFSKPVYFHMDARHITVSEICLPFLRYHSRIAMKHDIFNPTTVYFLRAVDFAGNLSAPIRWHLPYECDANKRHNPKSSKETFSDSAEFSLFEREIGEKSNFEVDVLEFVFESMLLDAGDLPELISEKSLKGERFISSDSSEKEKVSFEAGIRLDRRGCFGCNGLHKDTGCFVLFFVLLIFLRKSQTV